jgi:hypothetical protein
VFLTEHLGGFEPALGDANGSGALAASPAEREVFLQERFVVLYGDDLVDKRAKWRSVPEGTLWKTHIRRRRLVSINSIVIGDSLHFDRVLSWGFKDIISHLYT